MRHSRYLRSTPTFIFALVAITTLFLFPSCDNGNGCVDGSGGIVTAELDLEPFHSIITESSFEVRIEQGTEQLVEVDGQQNIIDDITTEVSDGIWLITLTGNCYNDLDIVIRITLPTIKSIESAGADRVILNSFDSLDEVTILVSGAGQFFQSGALNLSDKLTLQSTGAGELKAHFTTDRLEVMISGAGSMNLSGTTNTQVVAMTGAGHYNAFDLASSICTMENSGAGNAEISVDDELDVTISGAGNVSYKGNPTITPTITGSGELINAN